VGAWPQRSLDHRESGEGSPLVKGFRGGLGPGTGQGTGTGPEKWLWAAGREG
jgi:hypothetical protein